MKLTWPRSRSLVIVALDVLCYKEGVHDSARRFIGYHCPWSVYCGTAPLPPLRHRNIDLMVPGAISAWLRHTPRNGKPLFSMDLALLEVGYKEAQHSFLTSFWPSFDSNLALWLRRRSKRKTTSATLLFAFVSLKTNHATTFGGASSCLVTIHWGFLSLALARASIIVGPHTNHALRRPWCHCLSGWDNAVS